MRTITKIVYMCCFSFLGCATQPKKTNPDLGSSKIEEGRITLANPDLEYEVIIMDNGFESWFTIHKKPKNYYTLDFLETKNRRWIQEWNTRAMRMNSGIEYLIDYNAQTNYGYDVNYLLYHYLLYFQQVNNLKLD